MCAISGPETSDSRVHMGFDRIGCHVELLSNFFVAQAVGRMTEASDLLWAKIHDPPMFACALDSRIIAC